MAEEQQSGRHDATDYVYTFGYTPNIKRDGTNFDSSDFSSGTWMRFQRGRPRKVGGFRRSFLSPRGIPRQLITQTLDGVAYIFVGSDAGIDAFTASASFSDGAGPFPVTILNTYGQTTVTAQTTNTFTVAGDKRLLFAAGGRVVFGSETSQTLFYIASSTFASSNTTVTIGQIITTIALVSGGTNYRVGDVLTVAGGTSTLVARINVGSVNSNGTILTATINFAGVYTAIPTNPVSVTGGSGTGATFNLTFSSGTIPVAQTQVWRYLDLAYAFSKDAQRLWQFDVLWNQTRGQGQLLAHGSLNLENVDNARVSPVWYGDFIAQQFQWVVRPMADTGGQTPTYQPILVDGGVLAMYPFIMVYGSNGFVKINNVNQDRTKQDFTDWNGAFAQEVNYAGTKIIRSALVRGGQNSPSALLFTADGLVRVSFQPNASGGQYWVADQIAAKISIISSNSMIQIGNSYYWMGVDRWYVYNGTVQSIKNDKNTNYVFDNINFTQRQKVWAQSVPRFNEVIWYYPAGVSTECNRAVVYNTVEQTWYDFGESNSATENDGVRRCAGYVSEVYPRPFACGYEASSDVGASVSVVAAPVTSPPLPAPTTSSFYVAGDQTPAFAPGYYISLTADGSFTTAQKNAGITLLPVIASAQYYGLVGSGGTAVNANVTRVTTSTPISAQVLVPGQDLVYPTLASGYPVYEHETESYNKIEGTRISSIYSAFETNDISWVSGQVVQQSPRGDNYLIRIKRLEPDFNQVGEMKVTFNGRKYARSQEVLSEIVSFTFTPQTEFLDTIFAQGRLMRLKFESDTIDGFYEMGKILLQVSREDQTP